MITSAARLPVRIFILLMFIFALFGDCRNAVSGQPVRINGSGTGLEMMKPLIKAYLKTHPGVRFEMEKPLGSSGAIKAVLAGALDIAVSSKPLKQEEIAQGATLKTFGKTPLAIVAGRNVPVSNISKAELEEIYSGAAVKWKNNEAIRIVLRPLEDIDTKILRGLSPAMDKAVSKAQKRPGMLVAVTDPESNEALLRSDGSIGAAGLAGLMVTNIPLKILTLDNVMPSPKTLASGEYPLAKDLNFVVKGKVHEDAAKFLDFIFSGKGRAIVEQIGVLVTPDATAGNR